jgi:hypothetical protein
MAGANKRRNVAPAPVCDRPRAPVTGKGTPCLRWLTRMVRAGPRGLTRRSLNRGLGAQPLAFRRVGNVDDPTRHRLVPVAVGQRGAVPPLTRRCRISATEQSICCISTGVMGMTMSSMTSDHGCRSSPIAPLCFCTTSMCGSAGSGFGGFGRRSARNALPLSFSTATASAS